MEMNRPKQQIGSEVYLSVEKMSFHAAQRQTALKFSLIICIRDSSLKYSSTVLSLTSSFVMLVSKKLNTENTVRTVHPPWTEISLVWCQNSFDLFKPTLWNKASSIAGFVLVWSFGETHTKRQLWCGLHFCTSLMTDVTHWMTLLNLFVLCFYSWTLHKSLKQTNHTVSTAPCQSCHSAADSVIHTMYYLFFFHSSVSLIMVSPFFHLTFFVAHV